MIKRYNRYIMPNYHQGVTHNHQGEFVKYEDHLAEVEQLQNIVAATRGRCACRFDDDDNIVEWCKFHSDERNKLQAKVIELQQEIAGADGRLEAAYQSSKESTND